MPDQIQIMNQLSPEDINSTNEVLLRIKTLFPFDFFPDEIIVDRYKINVIKSDFFLSKRTITIPLSSSIGVKVNSGPLFSQVEIFDPDGGQVTIHLENVPNQAAEKFRELVQGLVVAIRYGVNLTEMNKSELLKSAYNWGGIIT